MEKLGNIGHFYLPGFHYCFLLLHLPYIYTLKGLTHCRCSVTLASAFFTDVFSQQQVWVTSLPLALALVTQYTRTTEKEKRVEAVMV